MAGLAGKVIVWKDDAVVSTMTDEQFDAVRSKVLDALVTKTPIGRVGQPRDIANAYAWLASDEASFVHGATISVDGGLVVGT